ncbi:alpha/beta hydrolase [Cohnella xylanilytica]|uniref:Alpha/beta hydrolase n=1 Tax=Cohnella xylanilytica TaxID=557555 RepID=A0A841U039_9BACL|nr:alpha/beta hydrolase [Cohnella xylanilytica]MBB6691511.1 alpha/beta hydrolase [Cohnella xylanilytica]
MNIVPIPRREWRRFGRPARVPVRYRADEGLWRAAAAGMAAACTAGAGVGILGAPTGFGAAFDVSAAVLLNAAGMFLSCRLLMWLFRLLDAPVRPVFTGVAAYSAVLLTLILFFGEMDFLFAALFSLLYLGIGAAAGLLIGIWAGKRFGRRPKIGAALGALGVAGALFFAFGGDWGAAIPAWGDAGSDADEAAADGGSYPPPAETLNAPDPSAPGPYAYRTFTYGSGDDRHRDEFGEDASLLSSPVDGSAYIDGDDWPWLRDKFWGFDEKELPVNGRVWMPEGDGPFPLALMVHGNHLMEDFSDEGYDYLGELLASRGYAAVSVDENFLNYSVWSGIPDQDMKVRAWMLLKHIGQIREYAEDASTPFYGRIDFGRVALLGHSRGGQAVAMAADPDEWFAADEGLPDRSAYKIRAVIAIAPTDTAVDNKRASLRDVSYLTLQGASDADVSTFDGERQYARTSFPSSAAGFKASLYIAEANHGQFNTDWGDRDEALPTGLFLKKPGLSGEEQRQIAKAYVSAFLEATLRDRQAYKTLFRDYRAGLGFLPDGRYYGRFESARFLPIARYEEGTDDPSIVSPSITAEAAGMAEWANEEALDRERRGKGNRGVVLRWGKAGGSYSLRTSAAFPVPRTESDPAGSEGVLAFSMADLSWELESREEDEEAAPRVAVVLEDAGGRTARVPLSEVMPVVPAPRTTFTWLGWLEETLEDGKFKEEIEPAFQTYEIPLSLFRKAEPGLEPGRIVRATFEFGGDGEEGKVMLDDIGMTE